MKNWILGAMALALLPAACETAESQGLGDIFSDVERAIGSGASGETPGLTTLEIDQGLREALTVGTNIVATQLSAQDGYFADPEIRIPLPGRLGQVQNNLQKIGLSQPLDDIELRMNRAAEAAVPEGKRLVLDVVQSITLEDAVGILRGGDTAATDYLRGRTETSLRTAFEPHVESALSSSGAFTALDGVTGQYGLSAVSNDLRGDLTNHAVNLGLDGMFFYIAAEEKKIRENPVARTTDILRKVFGSNA